LHIQLPALQGGVLQLRRKGMSNRIAENAEANWRIILGVVQLPALEIAEGVAFLHSSL